jgi:hypothetical protein
MVIGVTYLIKSEIDQLEMVKAEGDKQLQKYAQSRGMEGRKDIKRALVIFKGKDEYGIIEDMPEIPTPTPP